MNKHLYLLFLLLGVLIASCSSGDDATDDKQTPVTPDKGGSWTVNMKAGMTRGLEVQDKGESSEKLVPNWETSELIAVYYNNQKVGYLKPSANSADLSAEMPLTGNLDTPSTPYVVDGELSFYYLQDKGFSAPAYTTQDGTLESLVKNYHYATATAKIKAVDNATHTLTIATANFANPNKDNQAIIRLVFNASTKSQLTQVSNLPNSQLTQVSNLTISSLALTSPITITPTSAASEIYVAIPATGSSATFTFCETVSSDSKYYDKLTATLTNGKYYRANIYLHEGVQLENNGPIWATMNVGATSVSGTGCFGDHFAWGDIEGHPANDDHLFKWSTTKFYTGNGTTHSFNRYATENANSEIELEDDAVRQNWHGSWRMPTIDELNTLKASGYSNEWVTKAGTKGREITGPNTNKLFLPAAGYRAEDNEVTSTEGIKNSNEQGYYWSSTNNGAFNNEYWCGQSFAVFPNDFGSSRWHRRGGFSVRGILP